MAARRRRRRRARPPTTATGEARQRCRRPGFPAASAATAAGYSQPGSAVDGLEHPRLDGPMTGRRAPRSSGRDHEPGAETRRHRASRGSAVSDSSREASAARRSSSSPGCVPSARVRVAPLSAHGCRRSTGRGQHRRRRPSTRPARTARSAPTDARRGDELGDVVGQQQVAGRQLAEPEVDEPHLAVGRRGTRWPAAGRGGRCGAGADSPSCVPDGASTSSVRSSGVEPVERAGRRCAS